MPDNQNPLQLIENWKVVEKDPRFLKLTPDKQSEMRHFYVDNVVLAHPRIQQMMRDDPTVGPRINQSFFAAETAAADENAAQYAGRLTSLPMSQGLGIRGSRDMKPGIQRGLTRVAEGLTSLENLGLLVGTAGLGPAVAGGSKLLGATAPTAARIARGVQAGTSAGFAYQMGKGVVQGVGQLDELSEYLANPDLAPEQRQELEAIRRETLTEMAATGLFAYGAGSHALKAGRAGITGVPEGAVARRLTMLGHNPKDFIGRLDEADNVLRNQIPASRYKKPQAAVNPTPAGGPSTAYGEPESWREPDMTPEPVEAPVEAPAPAAAAPSVAVGESPAQTAARSRLAQAMKVPSDRISLQKPPELNGGIEIQIAGKPSGNAQRRAAEWLEGQGHNVSKFSKGGGFTFTDKKGVVHRVRFTGYESKQSDVTPVTPNPSTKVLESPTMETPTPVATESPSAPAVVPQTTEHPLTPELGRIQATIANYQEQLRTKGRDPENLLRSDAVEMLRSQGEEVGPDQVLPAPLEALMNHADALRSQIENRGPAKSGEVEVTRKALGLMREKTAERSKLVKEHGKAMDYVRKEIDAHEKILEDQGISRADWRDGFVKANGGNMDLMKYRALLRKATGKNLRGEEGFRGKGFNPKSKDPMKGAEYRDDTRINWLSKEIDRVDRDIELINKPKAGSARARMERNIQQRAPELNAYPSLQEAAAPQGQPFAPAEQAAEFHPSIDAIVGDHPAIRHVKEVINKVRNRSANVLITGETGVGKELVARALHESSNRAETGDYVPVNVSALPRDLIESELFGSEKGSFTGAERTRLGLLAQAHNGTLFLDEIGDLPVELQTKLLRAIQEKKFRPIGGSKELPFDARIVAATNRDITDPNVLRQDLRQRLDVVRTQVPSLRERASDIPALAQHFLNQEEPGVQITPEAMAKLQGHSWPGNVRELQNAISHALALRENDGVIDVRDLPETVQKARPGRAARPMAARPAAPQASAPARPEMRMAAPNPAEIATRREKQYLTEKQVAKKLGTPMPTRVSKPVAEAPAPVPEPVQAAPDSVWEGMNVVDQRVADAKVKMQQMAEQAEKPVARPPRVNDVVSASLPNGQTIEGRIVQDTGKGFKVESNGKQYVVKPEAISSAEAKSLGLPPGFLPGEKTASASFYNMLLDTINRLENQQGVDAERIAWLQKFTGVDLTGEAMLDKDGAPLLDTLGNPRVKNISRKMQLKRLQDYMVRHVQADTKVRLPQPDVEMSRDAKLGGIKQGDIVRIARVKAKSAQGRVAEVAPDYIRLDDGTRVPFSQIRGKIESLRSAVSSDQQFEKYEDAKAALDTHFGGKGSIEAVRDKNDIVKGYKLKVQPDARPTKPDTSISVTPMTPEEMAAKDNQTGAIRTVVNEDIGTEKVNGVKVGAQLRKPAIPGLTDRTAQQKPTEVTAPQPVVTPETVIKERTAKLHEELKNEPDPAKRLVLVGKINAIVGKVREEFKLKEQQAAVLPRVVTSEKLDKAVKLAHDAGALKPGKTSRAKISENRRWLAGLDQPKPPTVTKQEASSDFEMVKPGLFRHKDPMGGAANPTIAAPEAAGKSQSPEATNKKWEEARNMATELVQMGEPQENISELIGWLAKLKGKVPKSDIVDIYHQAVKASLDAKKSGEKLNHAEAVGVIEQAVQRINRGASAAYDKPSPLAAFHRDESGSFNLDWLFKTPKDTKRVPEEGYPEYRVSAVLETLKNTPYKALANAYVKLEPGKTTVEEGWLSPDNKAFISLTKDAATHGHIAALLRMKGDELSSFYRMRDSGWIRKELDDGFNGEIDAKLGYEVAARSAKQLQARVRTLALDLQAEALRNPNRPVRLEFDVPEYRQYLSFEGTAGELRDPNSILAGIDRATRPWATNIRQFLQNESGTFTPGGIVQSVREWMDKPQIPTGVRRLDEIADERKLDMQGAKIPLIQGMARFAEGKALDFFDQLLTLNTAKKSLSAKLIAFNHPELKGIREDVEANLGRQVTAAEDPYVVARNVQGGGGGPINAELYDIAKIVREAQDAGLYNVATGIADLTGFERGVRTVREKVAYMSQQHDQMAAERANLLQEFNQTKRRGLAIRAERLRADMAGLRERMRDFQGRLDRNEIVPKGYDEAQARADMEVLKQNVSPEQFEQAKGFAERLWAGNRAILDLVHDKGIIGDEQYLEFVQRGDTYHPLKRIMENVAEDFKKFAAPGLDMRMKQKLIMELMGSQRTTKDPFTTSALFRQEALREVQRNEVAKTLVSYLENSGRDIIKEVELNYKPAPGEGVIGFYEGGKQRYYAVPDFLAGTIHLARPMDVQVGLGWIAGLTKNVFQKGTTLANLAFAIPNALRDTQDAAILSKAAPRGFTDVPVLVREWGRSLVSSLTRDPEWMDYQKSQAAFSTMQRAISPEDFFNDFHKPVVDPLKSAAKNLATLHPFKAAGQVIRSVEDLNDAFETATKLTAFKRLKQMGMEGHERDFEVRNFGGSPDFARRGRKTDLVNLMVMFFNANLQGIARTGERLWQNPRLLKAAALSFGLSAMALHSYNSQYRDENNEPLWNRIPDTDKQNYWCLLSGETYTTAQGAVVPRYFKFPKGHVARLIYNPLQEALDPVFYTGSVNNMYQTTLNVISNVLPGQFNLKQGQLAEGIGRGVMSSANPVVREPLEQASGAGGYDSFRGIPIEPRRLNEVSAKEAYVPTTSASIKKVAGVMQQVPDLERVPIVGPMLTRPMRLQHAVENIGGGVAQQTLQLADAAQGQNKEFNELLQGDERLRHVPVVGNIAGRFVGSPIDAREKLLEENFYREFDKAQTMRMTLSKIQKTEPQRIEEYMQVPEQKAYVALFPHLQKISKTLSELRGAQMMITKRSDLSPDERKAKIRDLYKARMELMKVAGQLVEQVKAKVQP